MNPSSVQSYKSDEAGRIPSHNYYSNRLFANKKPSNPTVIIFITNNNNTNNIVQLFRPTNINSSTSVKIDSDAVKVLIKSIFDFKQLKENWDGYGGVTPDQSTIQDAIDLIKKLPDNALPMRAGISGDGEISLVWENESLFADIGVTGDGTYCFFIKNNEKKMYGDDIPLDKTVSQEVINILTR